VVLIAICLGFVLIQLDATIVNVALPAIGRDVGGSFSWLQWVIDSYALVVAAGMLIAGSTADWFGARRLFQLGLVIFSAGSLACAAAPGMPTLIAGGARQGAGATALPRCSLSLIVDEGGRSTLPDSCWAPLRSARSWRASSRRGSAAGSAGCRRP
jgi:MFS transporter, DHA2 family, methylenomycin A resistance protein